MSEKNPFIIGIILSLFMTFNKKKKLVKLLFKHFNTAPFKLYIFK